MSSPIWMRCGGRSNIRPLDVVAWRVVEDQHASSTYKLVDSLKEHEALERLIDSAKPPVPHDAKGYHALLFTPFRYAPLPKGSRYGTFAERGCWYGSLELKTAFAETAYYRFLFLAGTQADLGSIDLRFLVFPARVKTDVGVRLDEPPFASFRGSLAHPSKYTITQRLGSDMRKAGVGAFTAVSARDPGHGINVAVLCLDAFAKKSVADRDLQQWAAVLSEEAIFFRRRSKTNATSFGFRRHMFQVKATLPAPSI